MTAILHALHTVAALLSHSNKEICFKKCILVSVYHFSLTVKKKQKRKWCQGGFHTSRLIQFVCKFQFECLHVKLFMLYMIKHAKQNLV